MQVKELRVSSGVAASRTLRKRSPILRQVRERVSGGESSVQLSHKVRASSLAARSKLLEEINGQVCVQIPPDSALALKADLCIPWTKLRVMRR